MANYYSSTLRKGSQGDEVKKWQNFLNSKGYNLAADGIFGNATEEATRAYQNSVGIGDDGVVGDITWGKAGYTNYSTLSKPTDAPNINTKPTDAPNINTKPTDAPNINNKATDLPTTDTTSWDNTTKGQNALVGYNDAKEAVNGYENFTYEDYVMGKDAQGAKDALDAHNANKPVKYESQWQSQLDALMNQIMNRDKFSYNMNEDALYQQYKDKYIQQGKMAMADTMGQVAAMTGGYGSSYAQSVGQQAYQAQLDNLNDIVPELYQMALDKYNMEGQELYNQYGLVADRDNTDYGRYRDTVSDWYNDRSHLQGVYNDERSFDYGKYVDDRNLDYTLHADEYQRLLDSLGIAQSDYYTGGDVYRTEQSIKNNEGWNEYNAKEDARKDSNDNLRKQAEWDETIRQATNADLWEQAKWDETIRQATNSDLWQQAQWDEAARQNELSEYWRQKEWDAEYGSDSTVYNPTPDNPVKEPEKEPNTVQPTGTKNTTAFINSYSDKQRYLQAGHSEAEWNTYVEDKIASFLRSDRLTDSEALYLIQYYGLS